MSEEKLSHTERFTKLPVWARNELLKLERNLEAAERQVKAFSLAADDVPEGWPVVGDYNGEHGRGLPAHAVGFKGSSLRVKMEGDWLTIRTDDGQPIAVRPSSSNVIAVEIMK